MNVLRLYHQLGELLMTTPGLADRSVLIAGADEARMAGPSDPINTLTIDEDGDLILSFDEANVTDAERDQAALERERRRNQARDAALAADLQRQIEEANDPEVDF